MRHILQVATRHSVGVTHEGRDSARGGRVFCSLPTNRWNVYKIPVIQPQFTSIIENIRVFKFITTQARRCSLLVGELFSGKVGLGLFFTNKIAMIISKTSEGGAA